MPILDFPSILLLAQKRIDAMAPIIVEREVDSSPLPGFMFAIAFATIAGAVAWFIFSKQRSYRATNDCGRLFDELCRANHLTRRQRHLLFQLSEYQQLSNPSQLLLNIDLWQLDPKRTTQLNSNKVQAELLKVRSLLFTVGRHTPSLDVIAR